MTKLEKYLADYLEQEKFFFTSIHFDKSGDTEVEISAGDLQNVIKQGLDAFESTENVRLTAAPILLEALWQVLCDVETEIPLYLLSDNGQKARKAIFQATGKNP